MRSLIVVAGGSFVQLTFVKVNGSQYTVCVQVSQSIIAQLPRMRACQINDLILLVQSQC